MFDNIGGKIKGLAVAVCCVGIVLFMIIAIGFFVVEAIGLGFLYLIIGPLLSWLASLTLFGFGHLIETAENIEELMTVRDRTTSLLTKLAEKNEIKDDHWVCGVCGKENKIIAQYCNGCGHKK